MNDECIFKCTACLSNHNSDKIQHVKKCDSKIGIIARYKDEIYEEQELNNRLIKLGSSININNLCITKDI